MQKKGRLYGCPVELALSLLGGKWKTLILSYLKQAPMRYADLQQAAVGLSDKVLTQRLRELEESGLIERSSPARRPSTYRLTARGHRFAPALQALYQCGTEAAAEVGARFRVDGSGKRRGSDAAQRV